MDTPQLLQSLVYFTDRPTYHLFDARTPHLGPHDPELESQPCWAMRHFRCGHANSVFCDLIYKISLLWSSVVGDRKTHLFGDRSA